MVTETIEVIPIGDDEPCCYIAPGHVDHAAMLAIVLREYEFDDDAADGLEPSRHTWMVVTKADHNEWEYDWYREVLPGVEGAEPYTLIAIEGSWTGPSR